MNFLFLNLPIPLFFVLLQLFVSVVWSQEASSSTSSSSSTVSGSDGIIGILPSANATTTASGTGATNSTSSASPTSSAQFPSLSDIPTCVSNCLAVASANLYCTSVVDVNCFCNNTEYPAQLLDCVLASCPDQVSTIETLGQEFCNQATGHPTLSYFSVPITTTTTSTSSSSTSSSISTSTSTAPSSTTSNIAAKSMDGWASLMGLGAMMVLGIILGGV